MGTRLLSEERNKLKRLRHPIRAIREPFGTAGLIVAVVALVAAVGGTALAAAKLNATQKKEVEKIAKKFAGKPGEKGAAGVNGGPGKDGTNGSNGAAGAPGAAGKGVVLTAIATAGLEGKCEGTGGTKVEVEGNPASKKFVCNGQTGFTETLPSEKTETGIWSFPSTPEGVEQVRLTLSFPIPLEAPIPVANVHYINKANEEIKKSSPLEKVPNTICLGTPAEPSAPPGELCVYEKQNGANLAKFSNAGISGRLEEAPQGAAKVGAVLSSDEIVEETAEATGSWAVTAP
jgi:hypothetical protein